MADSNSFTLGPFLLEAQIGSGGMGLVYRARHQLHGTLAAVKFDRAYPSAHTREAFQHEVRLTATLASPHCVHVLDTGVVRPEEAVPDVVEAGANWVAMALVTGGTLAQRRPRRFEELRHVLSGVLRGLAHAHARGVVHRDIKASNVLLSPLGARMDGLIGYLPVLTDFGISYALHTPSWMDAKPMGTPSFMAPEQWEASWRDLGPWTDLYQVGILAWQLATGTNAFDGQSMAEWMRAHLLDEPGAFTPLFEVPHGFEDWVRALLEKNWRARDSSAAGVLGKLLALDGTTTAIETPTAVTVTSGGVADLLLPGLSPACGVSLWGLRRPGFVGRSQERHALRKALERAVRQRRTQHVDLAGPPGIGKGRLAEWIGEQAVESGTGLWWHADTDLPTTLRRNVLRIDGLDDRAAEQRLASWFDDRRTVAGLIQWLLHDALPRAEWIALLGDVIERWTREQPLVTTHAIPLDPGVLAGLLGRPLPLLIVTCGAEPDSRSLRLKLGPLDREAQSRLLAQLIGFDRDLAFRVEQMSEGNPGFAVQIVNHWLETACVVPSATGLRLAKGVTPEPPASLIQAHAARTDRLLTSLAPNEVHALEIAAMLGDRVARHTWEQACEMAWVDPGDVLARSIDAGVLASTDDRRDAHQFTHALFRQHLVGLADQGGRTARWCAAAADALEPDAPLALRASLLSRADRPAQAFEAQARHLIQLLSAGEVRHHDAFEVLRLLDAAATAAHPGRGEARRQARIWELTAWAARLRGEDSTEAAHKAHTAAACSGDPAALFDATVALAHLAMEAADTTKAIDLFELAARYAAAAEDPAHVWFCHQEIASANMTRGRWDLAAAHVAQQPTDLRVGHKVELELQRARVAWHHRDEDRFRTHLERASEEADRAGQRRPHIRIENLRGEMHRKAGRLDEAMRCYQRGLSDAVRLQLTFDRMLLLANVALTQALLSRFQEAHETVEELRRLDPPRMFRTFLNPLTVAARAGLGLPVDDAIAAVEHDVETLSVADLDIAVLLELAMGLVPEGPIHERLRALASIHRGGVR